MQRSARRPALMLCWSAVRAPADWGVRRLRAIARRMSILIMEQMLSRIERFPLSYLNEIVQHSSVLENVINGKQWLNRFDELTLALERGCATYRQVEDHLFELKVLSRLSTFPDCESIEYQPTGHEKTGKNCDLRARTQDRAFLIELKAFHPEDRATTIPMEHIPENHKLIMDQVSFHHFQATRGHLIDIAMEVEDKMANYPGEYIKIMGVYIGFHLHLEPLRNFVAFYKTGEIHPFDPLGKMTAYELKKNNRQFQRTIDWFWAFPFEQCSFSLRENENDVRLP